MRQSGMYTMQISALRLTCTTTTTTTTTTRTTITAADAADPAAATVANTSAIAHILPPGHLVHMHSHIGVSYPAP